MSGLLFYNSFLIQFYDAERFLVLMMYVTQISLRKSTNISTNSRHGYSRNEWAASWRAMFIFCKITKENL